MNFRVKPLLFCGLLLIGSIRWSAAQEVVSGIFGFQKINLLPNSDSIVAVPFNRLAEVSVLVASVSGSVVQVQGTPGWASNQFVYATGVQTNTYFARFDSGLWEGRYFTVTNNGTNTLGLDLAGDSLTGVAAGDSISIIPYWTFATVFPNTGNPTNWNGIHVTTSTLSHKTDVLIPNFIGNGINLAPTLTYYLFTNTATGGASWRISGQTTNNNDDILRPNTYFIVRNNFSNATYVASGDVQLTKTVSALRSRTNGSQDNFLSLPRPIEVSLDASGLHTNLLWSANSLNQRDQLLVFNYTNIAKNKAPVDTYYYLTNQGWRKSGASSSLNYGSSNVFIPGGGIILRRYTSSITTVYWTNSPTY